MRFIKQYGNFLNERLNTPKIDPDILECLISIESAPTEVILELKNSLKNVLYRTNESVISDWVDKIKVRLGKWIDDKFWKRIITKKRDFYYDLIDKLNIFDLENLDDIYDNFPGFEMNSLYLAGGIDAATDLGAGWRDVIEYKFEIESPGKKSGSYTGPIGSSYVLGKEKLNIKYDGKEVEFEPSRVLCYNDILRFIKNPKEVSKEYATPIILNPLRAEEFRFKDLEFKNAFDKRKDPNITDTEMNTLKKGVSKIIEHEDEQIVRVCDAIFLGLNTTAAAGTYGELETISYMRKPIFTWMVNEDLLSSFSLWILPQISKLARNKKEMEILVQSILDYAE